jgi:hypothetical protein
MLDSNYQRLIKLAEEVFDMRNDPEQLQVDQHVIEGLQLIHPATVAEHRDENGPVAWLLVIPTTQEVMNLFIEGKISEMKLFEMTSPSDCFEALYLCSALVLPEYQRKGIIKGMVLKAIEEIRNEHPLKALYVWAFSKEGEIAAERIAELAGLPLLKRTSYRV